MLDKDETLSLLRLLISEVEDNVNLGLEMTKGGIAIELPLVIIDFINAAYELTQGINRPVVIYGSGSYPIGIANSRRLSRLETFMYGVKLLKRRHPHLFWNKDIDEGYFNVIYNSYSSEFNYFYSPKNNFFLINGWEG